MFCSKRGSVILGELVIPFLQYSPFTPVKPQPITPLRLPHIPPHIYLTPPHSKSPNPILLTPYSPLPILHSLLPMPHFTLSLTSWHCVGKRLREKLFSRCTPPPFNPSIIIILRAGKISGNANSAIASKSYKNSPVEPRRDQQHRVRKKKQVWC